VGIANLTRYNLCNVNDDGPVILAMEAESDGEYVKFEEAMEASSNSLQQLKAEILPMINSIREDLNRDALNSFYTNRACDNLDIVAAKLSAV